MTERKTKTPQSMITAWNQIIVGLEEVERGPMTTEQQEALLYRVLSQPIPELVDWIEKKMRQNLGDEGDKWANEFRKNATPLLEEYLQ